MRAVLSGGKAAARSVKVSELLNRSVPPPASFITIAVVPEGDCSTISRSSGNVCDRSSTRSTPWTRAAGDAERLNTMGGSAVASGSAIGPPRLANSFEL